MCDSVLHALHDDSTSSLARQYSRPLHEREGTPDIGITNRHYQSPEGTALKQLEHRLAAVDDRRRPVLKIIDSHLRINPQ